MSIKSTNICQECDTKFVAEGHNAERIKFCTPCLEFLRGKRVREMEGKFLDKEENE